MSDPPVRYHHDILWGIIDNPEKFELLSYLVLSLKYPGIDLYKTPKTRDNKRDAEGILDGKKFFLESKFIFDHHRKKLSHKEVGSNINIAIYEFADILWIFTNGNPRLDLLNFVSWHNEMQESILKRPFKIAILDRRLFAMHAFSYSHSDYQQKITSLKIKGYKSKQPHEEQSIKQQLITLGNELVDNLQHARQANRDDFVFSPSINSLTAGKWNKQEQQEIFEQLVQCEVSYQSPRSSECLDKIRIPIGFHFTILIKISNYFFNSLPVTVRVAADASVFLSGPVKIDGSEYVFAGNISAISDLVIRFDCRIDRLLFQQLSARLQVFDFTIPIPITNIQVDNLFFYAPFIGENNNRTLGLYKEKVDKSVYDQNIFVGLVTGEAGVGKSRFIKEVIDHCKQFPMKLFHTELIAAEGKRSFIRNIISFFSGVDPISFADINDQLIDRYYSDERFAGLFNDTNEFDAFKQAVSIAIDAGLDHTEDIYVFKIAAFVATMLLHLGENQLVLFVVEDLHHADRSLLQFIRHLYNHLKICRSNIVFLLAGRTEAKDYTPAFREFEAIVSSDLTYSVLKTEITPLNDRDSIALIKELVKTESRLEHIIQNRILTKTGNNPFNIIHTLLLLKSLGIIVEKHQDFEWRNIARLESITLHVNVEQLLRSRFDFYLSQPIIGDQIAEILQILGLFESRMQIKEMQEIIQQNIGESIVLLQAERIVRIEGNFIRFDHENLLQYIQQYYLPKTNAVTEKMIRWLHEKKRYQKQLQLYVRALNSAFESHKRDFFKYAWNLMQLLIRKDDWKAIERYGTLYIERAQGNETIIPFSQFHTISFSVAWIKSEYNDVNTSITRYDRLLELTASKSKERKTVHLTYLYFKTALYLSDVLISAGQHRRSREVIMSMLGDIQPIINKTKKHTERNRFQELHCWALNRLGICYRLSGEIEAAANLIKESLEIALEIRHEYYTHHNYYDLAGCLVYQDLFEEAYSTHLKCIMPILDQPNQSNAKARTAIRTGLFKMMRGEFTNAAIEMESAIETARRGNYLWELTRGLVNRSALYCKTGEWKQALEGLKTCLHFIDTLQAASFQDCVYSNLAFVHLVLFSKTKDWSHVLRSIEYFSKLPDITEATINRSANETYSFHFQLSAYNFIAYRSFLKILTIQDATVQQFLNGSQEVNDFFIETIQTKKRPAYFRHMEMFISKELSFYLKFMSFS